jgi:hypothetical protein
MSTASFNTRTVLKAMLTAGGANTGISTTGVGVNVAGGPTLSRSVGMSNQGSTATFNGVECFPLYLHTMQTNIASTTRHPNQTSTVLWFSTATGSLIGQSIYQESMPGGSLSWILPVSSIACALPDQSYAFNTATPGVAVWTSSPALWVRAPAVLYVGDMRRVSNPSSHGTAQAQGGAGDKIIVSLKSTTHANEFRIVYDFYSIAGGATPVNTISLFINGSTNSLNEFIVKPAVLTAINQTGTPSRRRDFLSNPKAQAITRP